MHTDTPRMAYVAIIGGLPDHPVAGSYLGIAVQGEHGYLPVRGGPWPDHTAAQAEADRRNQQLGLTKDQAIKIVLSSMARTRRSPSPG